MCNVHTCTCTCVWSLQVKFQILLAPLFLEANSISKNTIFGQKNVSGFWSPRALPQTRASAFLIFFSFGYETMSNCSQNCWIDWNSAGLCFKHLFNIGVWTLCHYTFVYGKFGPRVYNVSRISLLAKKKRMAEKKRKKTHHRTDFEADRWPETGDFFLALKPSIHLW